MVEKTPYAFRIIINFLYYKLSECTFMIDEGLARAVCLFYTGFIFRDMARLHVLNSYMFNYGLIMTLLRDHITFEISFSINCVYTVRTFI